MVNTLLTMLGIKRAKRFKKFSLKKRKKCCGSRDDVNFIIAPTYNFIITIIITII